MAYPSTAVKVDGLWGPETKRAFQYFAQRRGWYPSNYLLDGKEGHGTRTAIQKWLRAEGTYAYGIDGVIGKDTVDAMRRTLDKYVNWSFVVTEKDGTKHYYSGNLAKASYFPTSNYVAKLQTFLNQKR
ncbi:hypothetical protein [Glutamicibacter arilaitensis]|uniref:hypothetical protein n=1 Tax=Glutamicibacter arilaitensis TaxID=256701 RepID=UPI003F903FD7